MVLWISVRLWEIVFDGEIEIDNLHNSTWNESFFRWLLKRIFTWKIFDILADEILYYSFEYRGSDGKGVFEFIAFVCEISTYGFELFHYEVRFDSCQTKSFFSFFTKCRFHFEFSIQKAQCFLWYVHSPEMKTYRESYKCLFVFDYTNISTEITFCVFLLYVFIFFWRANIILNQIYRLRIPSISPE